MGRKGRKEKRQTDSEPTKEQEDQRPQESRQLHGQSSSEQQQHQGQPRSQQQGQHHRSLGPQQQQRQHERPAGPQQQQRQHERPTEPQQQQRQHERSTGPQQQQRQHERPTGPQQQQRQHERPAGPQQQQGQHERPTGLQQQQRQHERPTGPQQQQRQHERPARPQQQQGQHERPTGPQQQQRQHERSTGPQQQQRQHERPTGPQQQQGQHERPAGPQQQQGQHKRPTGPQQQQGQHERTTGPQQQQRQHERPAGPQQQQGQHERPTGLQQQQRQHERPTGPQQQQRQHERRARPQQQQGQHERPTGPQQQQRQHERPTGPQQQQRQHERPTGPQQQQGQHERPAGPQQQQGQHERPAGPQQQQGQHERPTRPPASPWGKPSPLQPQQQISSEKKQQMETQFVSEQRFQTPTTAKQQQETTVALRHGRTTLQNSLHEMYMNQIPKRSGPGGGKLGRKIYVEANMLKLNIQSNLQTNVVHYDVVITPDKPKFLLRAVFEEYRKKYFPNRYPAFDGKKNAYSGKHLPFGAESQEEEITIFDAEFRREKTFKIYMKQAALIDLSWLKNIKYGLIESGNQSTSLQALEIILKHGPACQNISVGRTLFPQPEPGQVVSLSNGVHLWVGVFQSVVLGSRPYVNIDVAHKRFAKPQSVISLMKELCQDSRSRTVPENISAQDVQRNEDKINTFLKGLKIQYELPGQPTTKRTYRVNQLVKCPRENKFSLEDGTSCTVEEYFLKTKNYRIQFPLLPCLWVGSRNSSVHIPAELCTIVTGQLIQSAMDPEQTSQMIRAVATDTRTRKQKIMNGFAKIDLNNQPTLTKEFNLSVQGEFEKVPARVLAPPSLQYRNQLNVKVFKGVWRANSFLKPSELPESTWTILNLDRNVYDSELYGLHDKLLAAGKNLNMSIDRAQTPFKNLNVQGNIAPIQNYFKEKKDEKIQLVVVIIPIFANAYSLVKQISELSTPGGIVTQCIKSSTLRKLSDATIINILLKINSKLNGVNHTFAQVDRPPCLSVPCILIGADVTHPSPDELHIPSIAAVAASHDPTAFQYNIELRLQSPRQEMIQDLEEIIMLQLKFFHSRTGRKPMKIIFYRDGVSEGQLTHVMHFELSAIKKAVARLEQTTECKIPITFLVVQKRHHVRLFPTDPKNSDDRNFNVQAGTIVDTEITHPSHIDFYLVSHASIQGTARPTKYRCICNENQMSEDEIEQLTYYLCHMFARCTRSVSYPAPTYYAHLAAFRARALIRNRPLDINNLKEEQRKNMNLQINKTSPMFFV